MKLKKIKNINTNPILKDRIRKKNQEKKEWKWKGKKEGQSGKNQ